MKHADLDDTHGGYTSADNCLFASSTEITKQKTFLLQGKEMNKRTDLKKLDQKSHLLAQNQLVALPGVKDSKHIRHHSLYWNDSPGHRNVKLLLRETSYEIAADLFTLTHSIPN
jgi:hypothetical protein